MIDKNFQQIDRATDLYFAARGPGAPTPDPEVCLVGFGGTLVNLRREIEVEVSPFLPGVKIPEVEFLALVDLEKRELIEVKL